MKFSAASLAFTILSFVCIEKAITMASSETNKNDMIIDKKDTFVPSILSLESTMQQQGEKDVNVTTDVIEEQRHLNECVDSTEWKKVRPNGRELGCDWVQKNPTKRCGRKGEGGIRARDGCIQTCDSECNGGNTGTQKQVYIDTIGGKNWETTRQIQYSASTGDLIFYGEQYHGLDLWKNWWSCGMTYTNKGDGLIKFIMENSADAQKEQKQKAAAEGLQNIPGWYAKNCFITTVEPMAGARCYGNKNKPKSNKKTIKPPGLYSTTRPGTPDYEEFDVQSDKLHFTLMQCPGDNNMLYFGVGGTGVSELLGFVPPGDGTSDKDNGVRCDIAFRTKLMLDPSKVQDLDKKFKHLKSSPKYNVNSMPYKYNPQKHLAEL